MTSTGRIDQAVLLLRDRLRDMRKNGAAGAARSGSAAAARGDPLVSVRQLARQARIGEEEVRKAFVRTLLAESLGERLLASLEFQSVADQVLDILEQSESGRALIVAALAELDDDRT